MNYKISGIVAIICAPFLLLDFLTSPPDNLSWQTGLYDFIYMSGWICSLLALQRLKILGKTKFAKVAFTVQFVLLALAQVWNVWVMIAPASDNILFAILDLCWPLSNIWMLVIGIAALIAKQLQGWKRFIPLVVGLWFPTMVVPAITLGILTSVAGLYSAIAFAGLGLVVYKSGETAQNAVNTKVEVINTNVEAA